MAIHQYPQRVSLHLKSIVPSNGSQRVTRKPQIIPERRIHVIIRSQRARKIQIKRRQMRLEASRRPAKAVERRIKVLKKLIPNTEAMGVDGLFMETADYILSLQRRVEVMRAMVEVLTGSNDE